MTESATCNGCGFTAHPDGFKPCTSAYHDLRCPKCGTTDIDTTKVNKAWKERGKMYIFGDHNCADLSKYANPR